MIASNPPRQGSPCWTAPQRDEDEPLAGAGMETGDFWIGTNRSLAVGTGDGRVEAVEASDSVASPYGSGQTDSLVDAAVSRL